MYSTIEQFMDSVKNKIQDLVTLSQIENDKGE